MTEHWIHIRKHDLGEVLYVDGERILENDVLLATEVLEIVLPIITDLSAPVLFTSDEVDDEDWNTMFPEILKLEDI